ncbi:AAA family ATPase [Endozoicomonas sp. SCSIO W0465]|uniref:AAA family ATPase n=1 Tax=Endozoicomonas sp. SCSIO W0465 TaxID=2918516 RepID=UPI00207628D6|nr:AAA family ATPase [Endozoicomonas sp. SCSIO W0465]USE38887.1 AAA family ATPase [Endozoicomonas sp. SCSIO W0465]
MASATSATSEVILLAHPDDLCRDSLLYRLQITEQGYPRMQPGKLFVNDVPLTLVLDIRNLSSEELPRFNDLLDPDNPCLYDRITRKKRALGGHVTLLVVADPEQLSGSGGHGRVPGADFWRRINRPGNTWQGEESTISPVPDGPLLPEHPEMSMAHDGAITVDCHLFPDWRQLLFGGPGVSSSGKICHLPGQLATLSPGQRVILKGADWGDLAFEQTIRLLIARQQFECNGQPRRLPDGIQFFRAGVGQQELSQLFQPLMSDDIPEKPLIINSANLATWLNDIRIDEQGYAVPNTSFADEMRAGGEVTVTSSISEENWFRLLGFLHSIHDTTGLKPAIVLAHLKDQPEHLGLVPQPDAAKSPDSHRLPELCQRICQSERLKVISYQQEAQVTQWLQEQPSTPLLIRVNAQTTFTQLFDNIHVTSEREPRFGRQPTALQAALESGQPVVIRGLETNEHLQRLLEPLCCAQPLLINGVVQPLPNAHVTLLWPAAAQSSSPLWNQWLVSARACDEIDIWEHAAIRYGIDRNALPNQAIHGIYQAFSTVGSGVTQVPGQLPALTASLLDQLIRSANQEKQLDQADTLEPAHWRKAINSVITHGTRRNPTVRAFMKFACEQLLPDTPLSLWVDNDYLARTLADYRQLSLQSFKNASIWPLARAFHPQVFANAGCGALTLSFHEPLSITQLHKSSKIIGRLIAAFGPEKLRKAIAMQLPVNLPVNVTGQNLQPRSGIRIKRLQDALASGWCLRADGQTRSAVIKQLAADCFHLSRDGSCNQLAAKQQIKELLAKHLNWTGGKDAPLEALADDLFSGSIDQQDREIRRLHRLRSRLGQSPVIFLEGETGTGKSHFAARLANASGPAFIVSIGPSATEQSLIKRWTWQVTEDRDRFMVQLQQVLLRWASTRSSSEEEYVTLVIDEANLAQQGLHSVLLGLWQNPPCIYEGAHPVPVSSQHRVILTGNPEHYSGRRLDQALKNRLPSLYYKPLDQAFLQDRVIEPALRQHLLLHLTEQKADLLAQQATISALALWQNFPELLPDHEFTPRDLTDTCAWVGWYLDQALPHGRDTEITLPRIHSLILQSFRDLLGPEWSGEKHNAYQALQIWFEARFPVDGTLVKGVEQGRLAPLADAFRMSTRDTCPRFDTSAQAVNELVLELVKDLSRCQQAYHRGRKHGGRQATLVEGPAGRGKDATLQLLINSYQDQVRQCHEAMPSVEYLNAFDCQWETLCNHIARAQTEGHILVISELNLIDSQYLEGELNDILAGDAHPGFHLFATINPAHFSGRKPISPALKGRFRQISIREYNREELLAIAQKMLPYSADGRLAATCLSHWHCELRSQLSRQKPWLQPTSLDLQRLAGAVAASGDYSEPSLERQTSRHYRLHLMAAGCTLNQLTKTPMNASSERSIDPALCQWFSATLRPDDRPWLIERSGSGSSINVEKRTIAVAASLAIDAAQREVVKLLARAQWQQSGLPSEPKETDDTLTQALYRRWQQGWFTWYFADADLPAEDVFTMDQTHRLTIAMNANRPYLVKADCCLSSAEILSAAHLWAGAWASFCEMLDYPANSDGHLLMSDGVSGEDSVDEDSMDEDSMDEDSMDEDSMDEDSMDSFSAFAAEMDLLCPDKQACLPRSQMRSLDRVTDYQTRPLPNYCIKQLFTGNTAPALYRLSVVDMVVSDEGDITIQGVKLGEYGFDAVIPGITLPEEGVIPLSREQNLAVLTLTVQVGHWHPLPSLNPGESITALRTQPFAHFHMIRDRYTGLHMLRMPELSDDQSFKITYIVEARRPVGVLVPSDHKEPRPDSRCSAAEKTILDRLFDKNSQTGMPEPQQQQLQAVLAANNIIKRINAIASYCQAFSGQSMASPDANLFEYLVRSRQGSCRHRAPVFVALCRYFGIPARIVRGDHHRYVEVSRDNGRSWNKLHLGGAPTNSRLEKPELPPMEKGKHEKLPPKLTLHLANAPLAQRSTLARVLGIGIDQLDNRLKNGLPLPELVNPVSQTVSLNFGASASSAQPMPITFRPVSDNSRHPPPLCGRLIDRLWHAPDMASFATGADLLIHSNNNQLNNGELLLARWGGQYRNSLIDAIAYLILYEKDFSQLFKKMDQLYERLVNDPGVDYDFRNWQSIILELMSLISSKDLAGLMKYSRNYNVHYEYLLFQLDSLQIEDFSECEYFYVANRLHNMIKKSLTSFVTSGEVPNVAIMCYLGTQSRSLKEEIEGSSGFGLTGANILNKKDTDNLDHIKKFVFEQYCSGYFYFNSKAELNELRSTLKDPAVIERFKDLCLHALSSGWLESKEIDPDLIFNSPNYLYQHYKLLQHLKNHKDTRIMATACLQRWHNTYLGKNQRCHEMAKRKIQNLAVIRDHGGHSPWLEAAIATRTLSPSWSDEPNGMPSIERLLAQRPAFPAVAYGETAHRPVIIAGFPDWTKTPIEQKNKELCEQLYQNRPDVEPPSKSPEKKDIELINMLEKPMELAFCHYLFRIANSRGGRLGICWLDATIVKLYEQREPGYRAIRISNNFGFHEPKSAEELIILLSIISDEKDDVDKSHLLKAHNAEDGIVLRKKEMTAIACEFINSVDMNSLYEEFSSFV